MRTYYSFVMVSEEGSLQEIWDVSFSIVIFHCCTEENITFMDVFGMFIRYISVLVQWVVGYHFSIVFRRYTCILDKGLLNVFEVTWL